jgi:transposase
MWFVGIDWADQHHDAAAIDESGQRGATLRVPHSVVGLQDLVAWLSTLAARASDREERPDLERVACIVETSSGLLITALLEAGFPVYPVNPKTLAHWLGASPRAPRPTPSMPIC